MHLLEWIYVTWPVVSDRSLAENGKFSKIGQNFNGFLIDLIEHKILQLNLKLVEYQVFNEYRVLAKRL